jgi:hypothetical protein
MSSAVMAQLQKNIARRVTPAPAGIPNGAVQAYQQEPFAIAAPTMTATVAVIAAAVAMSQFRTGVKSPRYNSPVFRQAIGLWFSLQAYKSLSFLGYRLSKICEAHFATHSRLSLAAVLR